VKAQKSKSWISLISVMIAAAVAAPCAHADSWPSRPVSIVVAGASGGGTDIAARIVADGLGRGLKQSFVVENRAGAGGIIGTKYVAGAKPDGYTFLLGHTATNAIVPALVKPRPYDPVEDFVSVRVIGTTPDLLVVSAASEFRTLADLLERAKSGAMTYGSPGVGLPQHMAGFVLANAAGVQMQHVPYRGSAPAITDLIGGQITLMFVNPGAVAPFIKSGQIRPLAITSKQRSRFFPDVPTLTEQGYPSIAHDTWTGIFAPKNTPPAIVDAMRAQLDNIVADPDYVKKFEAMYLEMRTDPVMRNFPEFVRSEAKMWVDIVQQTGLKAE